MPEAEHHAGFDAAMTLTYQSIRSIVWAAYDTGMLPNRVEQRLVANALGAFPEDQAPPGPRHPFGLDLAFRRPRAVIDAPMEEIGAPASLYITLHFKGQVHMRREGEMTGPLTESIDYELKHFLQVPIIPRRDLGRLVLPIDFSKATSKKRRWVSRGPLGDADQTAYGALHEAVPEAVLYYIRSELPEIDLTPGFLNDIDVEAVDPGWAIRAEGQQIAIGVDGFSVAGGPVSRGRPDDLKPFLTQGSVAAVVHPSHVDRALGEAVAELRDDQNASVEALESDYRIDRIDHELGDGHVRITGHITDLNRDISKRQIYPNHSITVIEDDDDIGVGFDLRARLRVDREAGRIESDVEVRDIDLDLPLYYVYLHAAASPLLYGAGLYDKLLGIAGTAISKKLDKEFGSFGLYDLPVGTRPADTLRLSYREVSVGHGGALVMADLKPPPVALAISAIGPLGEFYISQRHRVTFQAHIVRGYLADHDPDLTVEWEVHGMSRDAWHEPWSEILPARDQRQFHWRDRRSMRYTLTLPDGIQAFRVRCRILRGEGELQSVAASGELILPTIDRLDREKPMVRWDYVFWEPWVRKYWFRGRPRGRVEDVVRKRRQSKIHLTAYPGRCKHADRYSSRRSVRLQYLDASQLWPSGMPHSERSLDMIRDRLCPYCFFGGPAGEELKVAPFQIGL